MMVARSQRKGMKKKVVHLKTENVLLPMAKKQKTENLVLSKKAIALLIKTIRKKKVVVHSKKESVHIKRVMVIQIIKMEMVVLLRKVIVL